MDSKKTRRKSSSSPAAVKSPALAIKRSDSAPVTLQGWLYKQGSDGLQLWKKRWFVLSEFCLFYYKGPHIEKQLGSILLPSYSISPLSKDDGVYRKYAFKAEHANMRTYYFGAETKDSMIQWMNSLSLASILQNENNLRPEILARQLAKQGNYPPQMRHFPPPHRMISPPHGMQQHYTQQMQQYQAGGQINQQQQYLQQQQFALQHQQKQQQQKVLQQQRGDMPQGRTEGRQPLYANAPPKPKRLNTSRDYSPSPDNSPERSQNNGVAYNDRESRSDDPSFLRHRLPQERRTPEAYGRSNPRLSSDQDSLTPKEYEEVYNNTYNDRNEEIVRYSRDPFLTHKDRRMSTGSNPRKQANIPQQQSRDSMFVQPRSEYITENHGLPIQRNQVSTNPTSEKVPRPHSADFLEFDRTHSMLPNQAPNEPRRAKQPARPKSSIGEIRKSDDFWSEEVYAQKMRESAFVYDPSSSRSQSRAGLKTPMTRSSTTPGFQDQHIPEMNLSDMSNEDNFHPLQLSPARNLVQEHSPQYAPQLPPPANYQDNSPRDHNHKLSPRHPNYNYHQNGSPANQSFASSKSPVFRQNTSFHEDQLMQQHQLYREEQLLNHSHNHLQQQYHQQMLNNSQLNQSTSSGSNRSYIMQPGYTQNQQVYLSKTSHLSHPIHSTQPTQASHPIHIIQPIHSNHTAQPIPGHQYSQTNEETPQYPYNPKSSSQPQNINLSFQDGSGVMKRNETGDMSYIDNEPRITMPPSIPQPTPRKSSNHTPTMYQNIPTNSKSHSDPRPLSSTRLETATPNRFSERFDSDRSQDSNSDFRRSASARLPKQKTRVGEFSNGLMLDESDDSKRTSDQREESMKRLLEWKQRMLQSPLTRKSSRNTSRTQTPTNSDSPVPSLPTDDIRKRVIEELALQDNTATNQDAGKDRRISRKSSSGSRGSRSRSSPRIAPSKNSLLSSDDEDHVVESSRSRKRSKSQQSRSRNSSKDSRKSKSKSNESYESQPEYINIESLKSGSKSLVQSKNRSQSANGTNSDWSGSTKNNFDCSQQTSSNNSDWIETKADHEIQPNPSSDWSTQNLNKFDHSRNNSNLQDYPNSIHSIKNSEDWSPRPKLTNAIGPDDWYRDDFDFNKSHPFMDDPVLLKQYAQILDLKYRESSKEKLEEILQNPQLLQPAEFKMNMYERDGLEEKDNERNPDQGFRYPDSGYDTLQMSLDAERQNVCVDIQTEEPVVLRREGKRREERKVQTWHSRNFSEFQLMEKEESTVLLTIQGHNSIEGANKRSPREDKVAWSPGKVYQEIRKEKEAPPKNVVKERLRSFEATHENPQAELQQPVKEVRNFRPRSKSVNYSSDDSDYEHIDERKLEKKKSVKDLLSDFERKSKELQEKEESYRGIGSYLLQDSKEPDKRRVFSDTETLMYETSSDDENFDDKKKSHGKHKPSVHVDESFDKTKKKENEIISSPPPLPPKNLPPTMQENSPFQPSLSKEVFRIRPISAQGQDQPGEEVVTPTIRTSVVEDTYLAMTPSKSLSSLSGTMGRKSSLTLLSSSHNSRTSLTSSHGSSQSITSQGMPRFGSEKNLGAMTPTEALIQSATGSVNHSRTPSQTLVMEHLQHEVCHFEEETYVDMNEDGSFIRTPRSSAKEPILAKQYKKENLDTTLTGDSPESPRYCEIEDPNENAHYEYLYKARTPNAPLYNEDLYQEIEDPGIEISGTGTIRETKKKTNKKKEPEPLRPIEGLPDILGNAPTNKGNSSSDADDESSKDFDIELKVQQMITLDDSFRPASFYLSHSKSTTNENEGDSSDSDLVSPPPVPSSPPPMEEVLGYHSSSNLDQISLNNILLSAKSSYSGRMRRESQEDKNRRPSVSSRTSQGSQGSLINGSQQSLNRDLSTMSPHRMHGSHQSLSSRELPPIPGQSLLGSQQSLASKEIQLIGSRGSTVENLEMYRNSPYHSREGSLDNEMFLYHRFTQGSSISDPYRKHSSDELSSDTALYEQEYRKYHLENIQEVSNTLERTDSGSHNTSVISQDLNISYNSVYDSRLQQSKVYKIEDHPVLKKRKSLDERQSETGTDQSVIEMDENQEELSPRSKIPYYVSDIMEEGEIRRVDSPGERLVDAITKSMNALDVESNSYFESKNDAENERIRKLRRSYTPDPYLSKPSLNGTPVEQETPANNVSRSKSLEGLLGDSQGSARDNLGYPTQPKVYSPHNFNDISSQPRPARGHQPPPPPVDVPPLDIQPLSSSVLPVEDKDNSVDDDAWANTLRRASLKQQSTKSPVDQNITACSTTSAERNISNGSMPRRYEDQLISDAGYKSQQYRNEQGRQSVPTVMNETVQQFVYHSSTNGRHSVTPQSNFRGYTEETVRQSHSMVREHRGKLPPPTAPKPKTPVHFEYPGSVQEPVKRNAVYNHEAQRQSVVSPVNYSQEYPVTNSRNFLEHGLPSPSSSQGLGRLEGSQTLPARIRYSDSSARSSLDPEESPRTSKSGLQDPAAPVPPSPRDSLHSQSLPRTPEKIHQSFPQHGNLFTPPRGYPSQEYSRYQDQLQDSQEHLSLSRNSKTSLQRHQSITDVPAAPGRTRRRSLSSSRKSPDLDTLKKKLGGSLSNMTAGDLLGKTQEELVLLLIQLRRQAAALQETVDACKAELDNTRNTGEQGGDDLRQHTWELEEQLARLLPVIGLVDNMVKLGTLYRGNNNNKTSVNNINKTQEFLESRAERAQAPRYPDPTSSTRYPEKVSSYQEPRKELDPRYNQQRMDQVPLRPDIDPNRRVGNLEIELEHVQAQLGDSLKRLEANGNELAHFERDIFNLRQHLQASVERNRGRGAASRETLEVEGHLRTIQARAMELERKRGDIIKNINHLKGKENYLSSEIRPSPTGVAGAEPVPSKKRGFDTWLETDIDNNKTRDRGPDTELQLVQEKKANQKNNNTAQPVYINTWEEEQHNYENYHIAAERNPYEDDVQTVHSEGVRSEYDPPPLPDRPGQDEVILGLGELSEADERVQRFYGIIPKEKPIEIKTVRMVKRDNKERLSKGRRGDDDSESIELSLDEEEPPPPLPRGNYQNQHSFLSNQPNSIFCSEAEQAEYDSGVKPQFKLGEYYRRQESVSRPGSSLSAHERLFGTNRDESIWPEMSPAKSSLASTDSAQSALMSPVFKSAAARAIIEEERKTPMIIPKAKKKNKKRHLTITSSHPAAVLEAISRHEADQRTARSRDDLDIERMLKPRDAPDIVRSTYGQENDLREDNIDNLFGAPNKIKIPERYVPERENNEPTAEERRTRLKKADSIRRMLVDTTSSNPIQKREGMEDKNAREEREQLLALNQVLARQVMERSRLVAGNYSES